MLTGVLKPKVCKVCEREFMPHRPMQAVCGPRCALRIARIGKAVERAQTRARKEAVKTIPELIADAQKACNAYIRERDKDKPCFCCGKPFEPQRMGGSMDAGHFRSRGAAPHLRFVEDNIFAQRKNCNRPGGTTYAAMRAGAVARIGEARVAALEADNRIHKWTAVELREIRDHYKAKLKALKEAA